MRLERLGLRGVLYAVHVVAAVSFGCNPAGSDRPAARCSGPLAFRRQPLEDYPLLVGTSTRLGADRWVGSVTLAEEEGFWGVFSLLLFETGGDGWEPQAVAVWSYSDTGAWSSWASEVSGEVLYDQDPTLGHLRVQLCLLVGDPYPRPYRRQFVLFPEAEDDDLARLCGEGSGPLWHRP